MTPQLTAESERFFNNLLKHRAGGPLGACRSGFTFKPDDCSCGLRERLAAIEAAAVAPLLAALGVDNVIAGVERAREMAYAEQLALSLTAENVEKWARVVSKGLLPPDQIESYVEFAVLVAAKTYAEARLAARPASEVGGLPFLIEAYCDEGD